MDINEMIVDLEDELLAKIEEAWAQACQDAGVELDAIDLADMPCSKTIH